MRRTLLAFSILLALPACALFGFGTNTTDSAQSEDYRAKLEQLRADAQAGDTKAQVDFAATLYAVMSNPSMKVEFGEVDWNAMLGEADAMLEQQAALPDEATALQAISLRAELQLVTGRNAEALATWETAHAARPSFATAIGLMKMARTSGTGLADPVGFCQQNRSLVETDAQLHEYIVACYDLNPQASVAASVPWATEADLAAFNRVNEQMIAENQARAAAADAERQAEQQRRSEEQAAAASSSSSSSSSNSSSSPAASGPVHVTIKNNCRQTVKIFFGDKPKFGSGTYSSIGANTQTSHSFRPGDMMWIVDDGQNGISSTSVSTGMSRIEITESCTGLTAR